MRSETVVAHRVQDTREEDINRINGKKFQAQFSWQQRKIVNEHQYQLAGMVDRRSTSGKLRSGDMGRISLIEIKDKTDFGFKDQLQEHCSERLEDNIRGLREIKYVPRRNLERLKLDYQLSLAGLLPYKDRMSRTYQLSGVKFFVFGFITSIGFNTNNKVYNFSRDLSWNLLHGVLSFFDTRGAPVATQIATSAVDTRRKSVSLFVTMEFTVINLETGQIALARSYNLNQDHIMCLERELLKNATLTLLSQCIDLFTTDLRETI